MNLNPLEQKTAKTWYLWLWISPVFTIRTLFFLFDYERELRGILCPSGSCSSFLKNTMPMVIIVLVSACWHLILLVPALDKEHIFVRWHGRQALLLAGIRTIVALWAVLRDELGIYLLAIPTLIIIWLVGNLWGQRQSVRGDCSLMRWLGHQIPAMEPEPAASPQPATSSDPDSLVEIFRFSHDSQKSKSALEELKRLGLVKHFDNE
jgi:hypothetical protein